MSKAFIAVEGDSAQNSSRIHELVESFTQNIIETFPLRMSAGGIVPIEDIQDQVELVLMRSGEQKVARAYVLYRDEHSRLRAANEQGIANPHPTINVTHLDGTKLPLDLGRIDTIVSEACEDLDEVDKKLIIDDALKNLYDGVSQEELATSLVITARTLIEKEPNYTYAAARLLLDDLRSEALSFLGVANNATQAEMSGLYARALPAYSERGIELELLAPGLRNFDMAALGAALDPAPGPAIHLPGPADPVRPLLYPQQRHPV